MSASKVKFDMSGTSQGDCESDDEEGIPMGWQGRGLKRRRLLTDSDSSSDDDDEDGDDDEEDEFVNMKRTAIKNNLTLNNVKSVIKHVVSNDQVIEICKIRAEDYERQMQADKANLTKQLLSDAPGGVKLTRRKAKELNHHLVPLPDLTTPGPNEQVTQLIDADWREEDEDDDEYDPKSDEDEEHSDEYSTATYSDLDSLPRTPGNGLNGRSLEQDSLNDSVKFDDEGIFKVPMSPYALQIDLPREQITNNEENISKRTRSKLCLATTDIETIQETFVPPDITNDMYEHDTEQDHDWTEFLSQFNKPLGSIGGEEDEDADPEFVALGKACDTNDVNWVVSKKETQALLSDILEELEPHLTPEFYTLSDVTNAHNMDLPTPSSSQNPQPHQLQQQSDQYPTNSLNYQCHTPAPSQCHSQFLPSTISTPMTSQTGTFYGYHSQQDAVVNNPSDPVTSVFNLLSMIGFRYPTGQHDSQPPQLIEHQQMMPLHSQSNMGSEYNSYKGMSAAPFTQVDSSTPYMVSAERLDEQTGFTEFQLRILHEQLEMSVQIAAQNYLLTYSHPWYWKSASSSMSIITKYKDMTVEGSAIVATVRNVHLAHDLCRKWKKDLDVVSDENKKLLEKWEDPTRMPVRMMEQVVSSKAFIYPHLLPTRPFNIPKQLFMHPQSELTLFSLLFEKYAALHSERKLTVKYLVEKVIENYCPYLKSRCLQSIIAKLRNNSKGTKGGNPIQYFFKYKQAPAIHHKLWNVKEPIAPADLPRATLFVVWDRYIFSQERIRRVYHDVFDPVDAVQSKHVSSTQTVKEEKAAEERRVIIDYSDCLVEFKLPEGSALFNKYYSQNSPTTQEEVLFEFNANALPDLDGSTEDPTENSSNIHSFDPDQFIRKVERKQAEQKLNSNQEEVKVITRAAKRKFRPSSVGKRKRSLSRKKPIIVPPRLLDFKVKRALKRKLYWLMNHWNKSYDKHMNLLNDNQIGTKIFYYLKEFDIFANLLQATMKASPAGRKTIADGAPEAGVNNNSADTKRIKLGEAESSVTGVGGGGVKEKQEMSKRQQRLQDSNRLLLLRPERAEKVLEQDSLFAWNFYERVEKTYEGQAEKVNKFISILTSFKPKKDTVSDLYHKLEDFFLPEHPELAEAFLTCLLPGHAAQVGKFFEHFILTNMHSFVDILNGYFEKQPTQLKRIYALLNELVTEEELSMAKIKHKFLPLLKGNQLLIDWFLQLFPNERAPEANDNEFEVLPTTRNNNEYVASVAESEEIPGTVVAASAAAASVDPCSFEQPGCAIKYMQGRIHYGNRVILPADLNFLASNATIPLELTAGGAGSTGGCCVHAIKTAWDAVLEESSSSASVSSAVVEMDGSSAKEQTSRVEPVPLQLCDAVALKAHANRLNPPLPQVDGGPGASDDQKVGSPKKGQSSVKAATSPLKRAAKALTTAKKSQPAEPTKRTKRKELTMTRTESTEVKLECKLVKPDEAKPSSTWTREEDRMILEAINENQESSEEKIVNKLNGLLPGRSRENLKERVSFLLNIYRKSMQEIADDC